MSSHRANRMVGVSERLPPLFIALSLYLTFVCTRNKIYILYIHIYIYVRHTKCQNFRKKSQEYRMVIIIFTYISIAFKIRFYTYACISIFLLSSFLFLIFIIDIFLSLLPLVTNIVNDFINIMSLLLLF